MLRTLLAVTAAFALSAPAPAQAIHATARYVYVLKGNTVYQLDAETLELRNSTQLPGGDRAGTLGDVIAELEPPQIEEVAEQIVLEVPDGKPFGHALRQGISWLVTHQDESGRWDADEFMKHDVEGQPSDGAGTPANDVGVTGLALLALLGEGNTTKTGPYRDSVARAVKWLRNQQDKKTGLIGSNASISFIYGHAIATYALVEAYGLSKEKPLQLIAQRGINYLERHRNPYAVWRYQPRDNDNDTSVTGWCVMAYRAGQEFGLEVNPNALKLALAWFDQVTDPATGRTGYTKRGERSSRPVGDSATRFPTDQGECMTAIALCCKTFLKKDRDELMELQSDLLLKTPPSAAANARDYGYWYWGTYAQYQMGGDRWKRWVSTLKAPLLDRQRVDGNFKGSWDPDGVWGHEGGRVYSTAMACLTLAAYYRYSQLVR